MNTNTVADSAFSTFYTYYTYLEYPVFYQKMPPAPAHKQFKSAFRVYEALSAVVLPYLSDTFETSQTRGRPGLEDSVDTLIENLQTFRKAALALFGSGRDTSGILTDTGREYLATLILALETYDAEQRFTASFDRGMLDLIRTMTNKIKDLVGNKRPSWSVFWFPLWYDKDMPWADNGHRSTVELDSISANPSIVINSAMSLEGSIAVRESVRMYRQAKSDTFRGTG